MRCRDSGEYQALIDGELSRDQRKKLSQHLKECPECQDIIKKMRDLDDWMELNTKASFPERNITIDIDHEAAWERFNVRLEEVEFQSTKEVKQKKWGWGMMNKSTKWWVSGVASAAVIIGSLSIPQVQTVASEFLSVFRLNKMEFVQLTSDDIRQISNAFESKDGEKIDLKELGSMQFENEGKDRSFSKLEQAEKEGVTFPKLPQGYELRSEVSVQSLFTVHFQLKSEKVNRLLKQLQSDVKIDSSVDDKTFGVHIPERVHFQFQTKESDSVLSYTEFKAPEIKVEKGVDVQELRKVVLSLPFIPKSIKTQLVDLNDWQHTLLVPLYGNKKGVREIRINGSKGIIQESDHGCMIMWQANGKIRMLSSYDKTSSNELMQVAKSMN